MKTYAIYCRDKAGTADLRNAASPAHLKHVEQHLACYRVAGPMKDEGGSTIGSLLIVHAENIAEARAFLEQDPYYAEGFWETIHIEEFLPAAGDWIGGKIW